MEQAKQYITVHYVDMNKLKANTFTEPFKNNNSKTYAMASHSSHVIASRSCVSFPILFCLNVGMVIAV